jgi:hypothetical protein
MLFRRASALSGLLLLTLSTYAHEGHGVLHGHEPGHYLFSPEHGVPLLLVVFLIALFVGLRFWRAQKK